MYSFGGGNSTQPKEGLGMKCTLNTTWCNEGLGLNGLRAVAGPSMGSFQG
jgi:hypothetical protein